MRGTKSITHGSSTDPRITPACAGNRPFMYVAGYGMKDHPRVCGEQFGRHIPASRQRGSPPRVRGTAILYQFHRLFQGITPACAGNSKIKLHWWTFLEDHPRVCGEQSPSGCKLCTFLGSPPRVRGTVLCLLQTESPCRITPACAGNSPWQERGAGKNRDHPRVCGEQHELLLPVQ